MMDSEPDRTDPTHATWIVTVVAIHEAARFDVRAVCAVFREDAPPG
jgi:3-oxoacyl-[acyl-carrier-protein] synthase III